MVEQWKRQTEELVASVLRIAVLKNSKNFQKSSAMEFYFSWSFLQLILHKWFLDGGGKMSNFLKSQPPDGESWTSESPWQKEIAGHITTLVALLECNLKTTIPWGKLFGQLDDVIHHFIWEALSPMQASTSHHIRNLKKLKPSIFPRRILVGAHVVEKLG